MRHLFRAGALLLTVFILILIGPRLLSLGPAFLTEYGFHLEKTEENTKEWASLPIQYTGSTACFDCHQAQHSLWEEGPHRTISCENCHGPAQSHLETMVRPIVDTSRELCETCHARLISRPSSFRQVDMEEMGGQAECITCHSPHDPRAGMPPKVPHALEERTNCQSCHNPHEPLQMIPPQLPHTLEGRTECLSCHGPQEFRGATLPKIPHSLEGRTNCLVCHNPGGIKPFPEDHAGRTSATCLNCHRSK